MTKEASRFWSWFKKNNRAYLDIDNVDDEAREHLLSELLTRLHNYCENLYFEIGSTLTNTQELIITAEGDTQYFARVEDLVKYAPEIKGWTYTAFIQPREPYFSSQFEDVELKPPEMWFMPLNNKNNPALIGIRVCMPNHDELKESEWFLAAVYKVLDGMLGEKTFALDIHWVETDLLPDDPEDTGLMELKDLPAYVKWRKGKVKVL